MKRKVFERWFQACLVGSAIAGGCNRQEVPLARNESDLLPPVGAWAQRDPKATTGAMKRSDSALVPTGYSVTEKPGLVQGKEIMPAGELPPVVLADPPASPGSQTPAPTEPSPLHEKAMTSAAPVSFRMPRSEQMRTSVVAAQPAMTEAPMSSARRYGHAADYSWVQGEVQRTRKGWRLRYASLDETDTYGGSVTLADDPQLSQMKEGDVYRIEGRLQNPESHFSAPTYVVKEIRSQAN
jgi:hypothetical protein